MRKPYYYKINLEKNLNESYHYIIMVIYPSSQCQGKSSENRLPRNHSQSDKVKESDKKCNKSPLRYPGGKTRACQLLDQIMNEHFQMEDFPYLVSPFFGGGSFEFYIHNNYHLPVVANDKFQPLINFWNVCQNNNNEMCHNLSEYLGKVDKQHFVQFRENIHDSSEPVNQACMYFIINRCSFSGSTLSGGFSSQSSLDRFTKSSIDRIQHLDLTNFTFTNDDFESCLNNYQEGLLFLDPPYYLEKKSKLYGHNGDLHENFDHQRLWKSLQSHHNWMMTYNNCQYIRELYSDFKIIEVSWSYGMNKSKDSSEIVIINHGIR